MFQKFKFHIQQAIYNLRKSLMLIITLALAISMIAGLLFYFDGFEQEVLRNQTDFDERLTDIHLVHTSSLKSLNCTNAFNVTDEPVYYGIDQTSLDLEGVFKYQIISSYAVTVYANYSARPDMTSQGLLSREEFLMHNYQFNDDFYETTRFNSYFRMIEGTAPQNSNEIIIDLMAAAKLDITVGEEVNLSTYYVDRVTLYTHYENITMNVAGIFIPTSPLETYRIIDWDKAYQNYFVNITEDELDVLELSDLYTRNTNGHNMPFLGYSNFTQDDHPFQEYYRHLQTAINGTPIVDYTSGYGIIIDREFSTFFSVYSPDVVVRTGVRIIIDNVPSGIVVKDFISEPLAALFEEANRLRFISQLINIPILIIAIIIGLFASKSASQNKVDEFILLRSKGMSKQMVRRQILWEALVNGIAASILGTAFGFVTFYGHDIWVRPMIYSDFLEFELVVYAKSISIIISTGLGLVLSLLMSLGSIAYVSKLKTSELLTAIEQKDMDIAYDEQSVFRSMRDRSQVLHSMVRDKRKLVKRWSILFFFLAGIPVYYFIVLRTIANNSALIIGGEEIMNLLTSFPVFQYSMPVFVMLAIFLAIAMMRWLTAEAPILYAKISRFFGKIFIGKRSYLLGLQMMKRKQYGTVIIFLSVFTSIFVYFNVITYSNHANENVYYNYGIGSDLKVSFGYGGNGSNVTSPEDFDTIVQELKSLTYNGETLVNDALISYEHRHGSNLNYYQHYINFSYYLNLIVEGRKIIPNDEFIPMIMDVIEYRITNPYGDSVPGAIVNPEIMDDKGLEIGDIITIDYRFYDSRLPIAYAFNEGMDLQFRIIGVAEYFPGVYTKYLQFDPFESIPQNAPLEHIVVDYGDLPFQGLDYMLHAPNLRMFVDLDRKVESKIENVDLFIKGEMQRNYKAFTSGDFDHYIEKWASFHTQPTDELNPLLVHKISYLIFIVVLIQVALGLSMLLVSVRKKEHQFYGIMMSRGFGKGGVFKFMTAELSIIYVLSVVGGVGIGLLSSALVLFFGKDYNPFYLGQEFRIFMNPTDLLVILGSVVAASFLVFAIGFLNDTRKSISEYLYKF